jgi:hypothetical protein
MPLIAAAMLVLPVTKVRDLEMTAASGIARLGDTLYVIADDQTFLTNVTGDRLSRLPLFAEALPEDHKARKKMKPDLEAIVPLDASTLLALGSGSSSARYRGVLLEPKPQIVDLGPLYTALLAKLPELNIEGAAVIGDELRLLQRGNGKKGENAIVSLALASVLKSLKDKHAIGADAIKGIRKVELGILDGVPLSFTDACALPDGRMVFSAAAEASASTYDDGEVKGSVIGIMAKDGTITETRRLSPNMKAEGVLATLGKDGIDLLIVNDADDPNVSSALYQGAMR